MFRIIKIFTRKQKLKSLGLLVMMLLGALLESLGIGAILPLFSLMGQPDFLQRHPDLEVIAQNFGIKTYNDLIVFGVLSLIIIFLFKNVYLGIQAKAQIKFVNSNYRLYTCELMDSYLAKPYLFYLNKNSSYILRNLNSIGPAIFMGMLLPFLQIITEAITAVAIGILLIIIDPFTALVVGGGMSILIFVIMRSFRFKLLKEGKDNAYYSAQQNKWINQGLGAIKETKVLHCEPFFSKNFRQACTAYTKTVERFTFIGQLPRLIIETIVVFALFIFILCKISWGSTPNEILPLLGVLALAAVRLMPSANRIVTYINGIKFQMPFFNELYPELMIVRERLENRNKIDWEDKVEKINFNDKISVENISFRYPNGTIVLQNVKFTIPKGKFVGIIGASGAGKTTFVDILLGLLMPISGEILVDGKNIHQQIRAWQANLAYVPQTIYLIDGNIVDNIAMGISSDQIDMKCVENALKKAELYDFVKSLPEGMNTKVGERGARLSGGQRQRIGIARALYRNPNVLILDEATSALDNETEKSITDTILKLKGKITIISIAHRISTLEKCDFKIMFNKGQVEIV